MSELTECAKLNKQLAELKLAFSVLYDPREGQRQGTAALVVAISALITSLSKTKEAFDTDFFDQVDLLAEEIITIRSKPERRTLLREHPLGQALYQLIDMLRHIVFE